MAVQTVVQTSRAGIDLAALAIAADAGLTEKWPGTGNELLYVKNGGGGSINLTLVFNTATLLGIDGLGQTSRIVAIAAGKQMIFGPFPVNLFGDVAGNINITWSAVTTVTLLVFTKGA
jgi:hypothetical protein